ncbi:MAG: zinc/manganese transport system substrate-binding protein [Solirubrobacterales bacterium]|jgi:ABC-type Zn uptake system ZnuABC Zn-binding protein ZnuA|nr:zinc/manganese transport system substrate-binding protein [Solirubrobacterales bacterium]
MRLIIALAVALALAAIAGGCRDAGSEQGVQVVASTTQVADITRNVAGSRAEVSGILTPNADPHEYEPRPSDAEAVAGADLILKSGGDLDAWLDQVIESSGSDAPVVTLIDAMPTLTAEENGQTETDPHWWQDPRNAVIAVGEIRDALTEADPGGAAEYKANAAAYIASIERLDGQIAGCIDRVQESERKLVTSHDALSYYAKRYGIEVIGAAIPGLSTQAQASAGETADLIDLINRENVNAIFAEAGVSQSLEQAIAGETGATVGGQLWADALGPAGSSGATYLQALAANTETMVDGFTAGQVDCRIPLD